jgi:hypothetical protein
MSVVFRRARRVSEATRPGRGKETRSVVAGAERISTLFAGSDHVTVPPYEPFRALKLGLLAIRSMLKPCIRTWAHLSLVPQSRLAHTTSTSDKRWPGWQLVIGIEVHAQIKSRAKLFSCNQLSSKLFSDYTVN